MKIIESYFVAPDHQRLYYQFHQSSKQKAVLVFVHGLNEHSGRYQNPVQHFAKKNFSIYLFDHRGHGKSDGLTSHIDDFSTYIKDLNEFMRWVKAREKKSPIFMIGHSMGGQIVLNYLAQYNPPISGFLTSSANIEIAIKIPWLKKKAAFFLSKYFPKLALTNEIDPLWISRDSEVVNEYKKDPLVSKKTTLGLLVSMMTNQNKIYELASKIKIPGFMMHGGDDQICAPEGSLKFFEQISHKNKKIKIYDHFFHEIFNEIGKEQVFSDMEEWINQRLS
ncbi:MAG: alpha/beta hydrolase fold protein [uncultured bacterium]|nr:MAG: alpha/beta hydrolase fold protein [uncultured bacterium]